MINFLKQNIVTRFEIIKEIIREIIAESNYFITSTPVRQSESDSSFDMEETLSIQLEENNTSGCFQCLKLVLLILQWLKTAKATASMNPTALTRTTASTRTRKCTQHSVSIRIKH